jgi:hypothetical protein
MIIREHATSSVDPLDEALTPPADESPAQRATRLANEQEAAQINNVIDEAIKAERQLRKKKKVLWLLLLGQSESGKQLSPVLALPSFCTGCNPYYAT